MTELPLPSLAALRGALGDWLAPLPSVSTDTLWSLPLTLLAYGVALFLYRRSGQQSWVNPVLLGMLMVIAVLSTMALDYSVYFKAAELLHFLLGTATVALAVPLYRQLQQVREALLPIVLSVLCGTAVAASSAILSVSWLGGSTASIVSLAPKSTTTPVAMAIAEQMNGLPALAAVAVIVTGILGAVCGLTIMSRLGFKDRAIQGIALGIAAHGIGTARALQVDHTLGAYAGLAMGLSALSTALLAPFLWYVLQPLLLTSG